jgi:hypothetical protein
MVRRRLDCWLNYLICIFSYNNFSMEGDKPNVGEKPPSLYLSVKFETSKKSTRSNWSEVRSQSVSQSEVIGLDI